MRTGNRNKFFNKGEYVLRPINQVPFAEAPATTKEQTVVVYNENHAPVAETQTITRQTTTTSHGTNTKFAYHHTYDINIYYKVNDAFDFESSIDDLNKSIGVK